MSEEIISIRAISSQAILMLEKPNLKRLLEKIILYGEGTISSYGCAVTGRIDSSGKVTISWMRGIYQEIAIFDVVELCNLVDASLLDRLENPGDYKPGIYE